MMSETAVASQFSICVSDSVHTTINVHVHIDGADLRPLLEQLLLALEAATKKK